MNDFGALYGLLSFLLIVALYVWISLALSAVFAKAGEERFAAWIPIWNIVVLLRLGGLSGLLVLLILVPFLGQLALLVVMIIAYQRINRSFGFGTGMTVVAVLLFPIWASVVGWGSARWIGSEPAAGPMRRGIPAAPLDARVSGGPAGPATYGVPPRPPAPGFTPPQAAPAPAFPPPGTAGAPPAAAAPPAFTGFPPPGPAPAPAPAAPPAYTPAPPAPPVPPQPVASAPVPATPAPVPAAPAPPTDAGPVEEDSEDTPIPAFRSSARAAAAAAQADPAVEDEPVEQDPDADLLLGRSHAPFTQTVPTSFTPPVDDVPLPAAPRRAFTPVAGEAPDPVDPFAAPPAPPVPAPAAEAAASGEEVDAGDRWAPPPSTGPMPAVATRATRYSPPPDADAHFETSAEISAVAGAPALGMPMSARESVSAQHTVPEIPDNEGAFDETILAVRHRPTWMLFPPLGAPVPVTSEVLIIGRRPGADADFPNAQLVPVADETRTMSKTHARLERQGDSWTIVDLYSTNGVILVAEDGSERDAVPGLPERLGERFLLGDAELRIAKKDA